MEKLRRILPRIRSDQRDRAEYAARETRVITTLWPAWACFVCQQGENAAARLFRDSGPFTRPMERDIRRLVHLWQQRDSISPDTKLSVVARLVEGLPGKIVLALFTDEPQADRLAAYYRRASAVEAENAREHHFDGNDLKAFNVPPDSRRRQILDALDAARLDGTVRTFTDEVAFVEHYISKHDLRP
jgi:hypothetical protein